MDRDERLRAAGEELTRMIEQTAPGTALAVSEVHIASLIAARNLLARRAEADPSLRENLAILDGVLEKVRKM